MKYRYITFFGILYFILSIYACSPRLYPTLTRNTMLKMDSLVEMDTSIVNYYLPYKKQLDSEMNKVIGVSKKHLSKNNAPEFLVGNFFTDALLILGKEIDKDVQIAVATKGGVRTELKKGNITVGNIYEFMPFDNYLTVLKIKGTDLIRLTDFIASTHGQPIAGMQIEIKDSKVEKVSVHGNPINKNSVYTIVTYDYLANGGDNIRGFEYPVERKDTSTKIREGLIQYITNLTNAGLELDAELEERIKIHE